MIVVLYFVSVLFAFIYIFIITHLLTAWNEIEEWESSDAFVPDTFTSIIIPFRNEAPKLKNCIEHILANRYPKSLFEIILVNDHSEDEYEEVLRPFISDHIKVHSLTESIGKKEAIAAGVKLSKGKLIVTTDADCSVPKTWLKSLTSYYEFTKKRMIVGLVQLGGEESVLEYFQIMDTCGTMGLHGAGIQSGTHYLANGANLAFEKSLFEEIDPFKGDHYASGDDVFFINKVANNDPSAIGMLKSQNAIVESKAETNWSALWNQRKRWATKTRGFSQGTYKYLTGTVWLLSLSIIVNLLLIPLTSGLSLFVALTQLLIKGIMDFLYLQNMCAYFDKSSALKYFLPALVIQTFYVFIAGIFALIGGNYTWKGRKVSVLLLLAPLANLI